MGIIPDPPLALESAAELCAFNRIKLRPEGRALLRPGLTPSEYFRLLLENQCYADARRVLAHALPKRRALWWGCQCAWAAYRPAPGMTPPAMVAAVLEAVSRFVADPSEDKRRATEVLGKQAKSNTLAGCLAMAAFFSGGSVSKPGLPLVAPRPFITGRLVGVTVYLASVLRDPAQYQDRLRQYLALGLELARGNHLWTEIANREPAGLRVDALLAPVLPAGVPLGGELLEV